MATTCLSGGKEVDEGKIITIATRKKGLGKMAASWTETWEAAVLEVREMKTKRAKRTAETISSSLKCDPEQFLSDSQACFLSGWWQVLFSL